VQEVDVPGAARGDSGRRGGSAAVGDAEVNEVRASEHRGEKRRPAHSRRRGVREVQHGEVAVETRWEGSRRCRFSRKRDTQLTEETGMSIIRRNFI
jgi:hypothetical protein